TAVDTGSDWITLQSNPGYRTGDAVIYDDGEGTPLGTSSGTLTSGTTYYVIADPTNPNRVRLAATPDDANAGRYIDLTSKGTGTKHSLRKPPPSISLGSSPVGGEPVKVELPDIRSDMQTQVISVSVSGGFATNAAVGGALP